MRAVCSTCNSPDSSFVIDAGYITCTSCGSVAAPQLDSDATGYQNIPTHSIKLAYTRINRFRTKILGALQRRLNHKVDLEVLALLKAQFDTPPTPERFIEGLTQIELSSNRRKPYMYVAYYYQYIFNVELPHIPTHEERLINRFFAEVFYATNRLALARPTFPMTTLLRLIVFTFEFSPETTYTVRFTKGLRCAKRRRRYREEFEKCLAYIIKDGDRSDLLRTLKRRKLKVPESAIYEVGRPQLQARLSVHLEETNGQGRREQEVRHQQDYGPKEWAALFSLL